LTALPWLIALADHGHGMPCPYCLLAVVWCGDRARADCSPDRATITVTVTDRSTVLYVDHAPAMGGAEHSLLALLTALDRDRFRPVLVAADGPMAEAARCLAVPVHLIPMARLRQEPAAPWRLIRAVRALAGVIRLEDAALIHTNTLRATAYGAVAAAWSARPMLWHVREIIRPGLSSRWMCGRASAVVAISRAVARALPCSDRAEVIYNPVAPPVGRPRSRSELGLPTEGVLVASVGRLRSSKGHGIFVRMAAQVRDAEARFVVVGGRIFEDSEPDYGVELNRLISELGLSEKVTLTGHREDLADIWPHISVLVNAGETEGFGRVVAEALGAGVPVVAVRDGGVPEIVDNGETGLLVNPGDLTALAEAVSRLLADPDRRASFGRTGQEQIRRRFDPSVHARAVEAVYARLLAGRGTGRRT